MNQPGLNELESKLNSLFNYLFDLENGIATARLALEGVRRKLEEYALESLAPVNGRLEVPQLVSGGFEVPSDGIKVIGEGDKAFAEVEQGGVAVGIGGSAGVDRGDGGLKVMFGEGCGHPGVIAGGDEDGKPQIC